MDSQDGVGGESANIQGGGPLKRWTTVFFFALLLAAMFLILVSLLDLFIHLLAPARMPFFRNSSFGRQLHHLGLVHRFTHSRLSTSP